MKPPTPRLNRRELRRRARNARRLTPEIRRKRLGVARATVKDMIRLGVLPEDEDIDEAARQYMAEMELIGHEAALREEIPDDYAAVVFVSMLMEWVNG